MKNETYNEISKEFDIIDKAFLDMSVAVKQMLIQMIKARENIERQTALYIFDKIHELGEMTADKSDSTRWIKLQLLIGELKKEFGVEQ